MSLSVWEILLILVIVGVIFGAGKLPKVMGDFGEGIRRFKDGLKDPKSTVADTWADATSAHTAVVDNKVATAPASPVTKDEPAARS
ncbi:twin-arginine translocase TatA/TatE family subunit [Niveispirillum sp. SYP-B3756]|uniref:Sec-independent protein translocase subunit TatA/TatB n=1 Tax=Niveispirillum sp. SYP-B3756 TaxID=2662178 RepID=UPI0012917895|nr:twin-arginine translocase TatA/TatE family subunit [Niveispirillum sp. SYP-B3756]MQP67803.1 twin-arginine translocase TatA/TatE family subunit [Niveispirillum sp. SYP-B3756]